MKDRFDELEAKLVVITGPMFAGKSSELITTLKKYEIAGYSVLLIKPEIDRRYSDSNVVSHDGTRMPAISLPLEKEASIKIIKNYLKRNRIDVIGVDEAQFFSPEFMLYLKDQAEERPVYIAGLNLDFRGEPWESIKEILPYADEIRTLYAICMYRDPETGKICGRPAARTQRLINGKPAPYNSPQILVGGMETYEPRCKKHHIVPK